MGSGDLNQYQSAVCVRRQYNGDILPSVSRVVCGDRYTIVSTKTDELFGWGCSQHFRLGIDRSDILKRPFPIFGYFAMVSSLSSFGTKTILLSEKIMKEHFLERVNILSPTEKIKLIMKSDDICDDIPSALLGPPRVEVDLDTDTDTDDECPAWLAKDFAEAKAESELRAQRISIKVGHSPFTNISPLQVYFDLCSPQYTAEYPQDYQKYLQETITSSLPYPRQESWLNYDRFL